MRRCNTCVKLKTYKKQFAKKTYDCDECVALNRLIGKKADCWAWSDDPAWLEKIAMDFEGYLTQNPNRQRMLDQIQGLKNFHERRSNS